MCELLAVAFDRPRPFAEIAGYAGRLEELGIAGFGWGVAWTSSAGRVEVARGTGRFVTEGRRDQGLLGVVSARFLVHLRRPSRLSTIQPADTQPFVWQGEHAFCHNGLLERAEELRYAYQAELRGKADSEVGWAFFRQRLRAGATPAQALRDVDSTFGGEVNLGYLGANGAVALYSRHCENRLYRFVLEGGTFGASSLHSADESVFQFIFSGATERTLIEAGGCFELAGPVSAAA